MSNLQFEDDYQGGGYHYDTTPKGMAGFLVNKGLVKDKKTAEIILIIFSVILLIVSFIILRNTYSTPTPRVTPINNTTDTIPGLF